MHAYFWMRRKPDRRHGNIKQSARDDTVIAEKYRDDLEEDDTNAQICYLAAIHNNDI